MTGASRADAPIACPLAETTRGPSGSRAHEDVHAVPVAVEHAYVQESYFLNLTRRQTRGGDILYNLSKKAIKGGKGAAAEQQDST